MNYFRIPIKEIYTVVVADFIRKSKMDIGNIRSVQRVVNFTPNNGKMLRAEQPEAIISGVTMICDLPLLFMNGLPTCLENLSIDQLEKFIPYMINCSGESSRIKPKWWPHDTDFSAIPMREPQMSDGKWLSVLKRLVVSCYSYHGCDYALRLCAKTAHQCHSEWTLVDGLDGTIYLYNKETRQVSTTFKSANIMSSRTRQTFSNSVYAKNNVNYESMRKNKPPIQIYLCDKCDSEFRSFEEMKVHEKRCPKKCSLTTINTPEHLVRMPKNRVPDNGTQKSRLKRQEAARKTQSVCSSQYFKKQTSIKTLTCDDHNRRPKRHSYLCKSCGSNFDSLKKLRNHGTSCLKNSTISSQPRSSCRFSLNSCSSSFNSDKQSPGTQNSFAKCNVSLVKSSSPARKKRMSLIPNMKNQEALLKLRQDREVYLCDKCDEEFSSFSEAQNHETHCKDRTELTPSPVSVDENDTTQEYFLKYFHLSSSSLNPCPASQGRAWFGNPMRYSSIPIASPLGNLIHGRSRVPSAAISSKMEKVERYCPAKPTEVFKSMRTKQNTEEWRVSWKLHKNTTEYSIRTYLYPIQRWWEMPLLRKMQIKEEKKLRLLRTCKSMQVSVRRMTDKEIQNYSSCRSVSVRLKKLSLEEIHSHTNRNESSPIFKKVLSQESLVYMTNCSVSPKIKRLSLQEIQKYTKPMLTLCDVTHQVTNAGLISINLVGHHSSKTVAGNESKYQKAADNPHKARIGCKRRYSDQLSCGVVPLGAQKKSHIQKIGKSETTFHKRI